MAAASTKIERTIFVKFAAIDAGLSKVAGQTVENMDKFGNSLKDMASPLADVAKRVLVLDAALNTLAAGGLTYAFLESVKFNAAMADVKKVLSPKEIDNINGIKDAVLGLSNQYGLSAEEIAGSLANWKKQGFAVAESLDLVKNSLDFVIAADLSAAKASEIYIASIAGFEIPAEKAVAFTERIGNSINEVANNFAVDGPQIGTFLKGIAAQANIAGFSLEEIISIGVPVIETFRDASLVSNALKISLNRLSSESDKVVETMGILGVAQKDSNGDFRQTSDIYRDVRTSFQGLSKTQQSYYSTQLFGLEQSSRMLVALRSGSKAREVQKVAIKGQTAALGEQTSIQKEVTIAMETTKKAMDRFEQGFKNLSKVVGDKYEPAIASVISGATDILEAIQNAVKSGAFKQIFEFIADYSKKIVEYFDQIKVNLPKALEGLDFSAFLNTLKELEGIIVTIAKNIFGGDLTSETGLKNAMQKAIDAFTKLREVSNTIIKEWSGIIEKVGKMATSFGDLDSSMTDNIGTWLAMAQKAVFIGGSIVSLGVVFSTLNSVMAFSRVGFLASGKALTGMGSGATLLLTKIPLLGTAFATLSGSMMGSAGLVGAALAAGAALGTLINQFEFVQKAALGFFDSVHGLFGESVSEVDDALKRQGITIKEFQDIASKDIKVNVDFTGTASPEKPLTETVKDVTKLMNDFSNTDHDVIVNSNFTQLTESADKLKADFAELAAVTILPKIEFIEEDYLVEAAATATKIANTIETEFIGYFNGNPIYAPVVIDPESKTKVQKDIDKITDSANFEFKIESKELEETTKRFEALQKTLQKKIDVTGMIDLANIEGTFGIIEQSLTNINTTIESSSSVLQTSINAFAGIDFTSSMDLKIYDDIKTQMEIENKLRFDALEIQKLLLESQIELNKAKAERLKSGESIKLDVKADNLAVPLEMIWFEVLKGLQVRMNAEGAEALIGL